MLSGLAKLSRIGLSPAVRRRPVGFAEVDVSLRRSSTEKRDAIGIKRVHALLVCVFSENRAAVDQWIGINLDVSGACDFVEDLLRVKRQGLKVRAPAPCSFALAVRFSRVEVNAVALA